MFIRDIRGVKAMGSMRIFRFNLEMIVFHLSIRQICLMYFGAICATEIIFNEFKNNCHCHSNEDRNFAGHVERM